MNVNVEDSEIQAGSSACVAAPLDGGKQKAAHSKRVNVGYILQKLGGLIILFAIAHIAVLGEHVHWRLYTFLYEYLKFGWIVILYGFASHFYGEAIPEKWFDYTKKPYLPWKWEQNGRIYEKKLHISKWKEVSMDAAKAFPMSIQKKIGPDLSFAHLDLLLRETCRAEFVHYTIILGGGTLMVLLLDGGWKWFFLFFYVVANLSSVAIQRYNRPRYRRLLEHQRRLEEKKKARQSAVTVEALPDKETVEKEG